MNTTGHRPGTDPAAGRFQDSLIYEARESQPRVRRLVWRLSTGLLWLGFLWLLLPVAQALPADTSNLLADAVHWFGEAFNALLPVRAAMRRLADPMMLAGLPIGLGLSMALPPAPDPIRAPHRSATPSAETIGGHGRATPALDDPMRHCRRMIARHDDDGRVVEITPSA